MRASSACFFALVSASAAAPLLRSFGVALKALNLEARNETTVFEHTLSAGSESGAVTQQWHAGASGVILDLRVRVYVDGEETASVDFPVGLSHGVGPSQTTLDAAGPYAYELFGRTNAGGFWNTFLVPFQASVRVTLTVGEPLTTWYMCRGVENGPLVAAGVPLPPTARLMTTRTQATVAEGTLVTWASVAGRAGLLRQLHLLANSSNYHYQEGCVSAVIDGVGLWLSSGLEDYFLGAYFHSMPALHSRFSGFARNATAEAGVSENSIVAYRIHEHDPVLFSTSFALRWIATSNNKDADYGYCNFQWPARPVPDGPPPVPHPATGNVTLDALAFLYVW